jgi:hypothetical protein
MGPFATEIEASGSSGLDDGRDVWAGIILAERLHENFEMCVRHVSRLLVPLSAPRRNDECRMNRSAILDVL